MLTPADIENKQFTTTRIKEGYVQEEVDSFLDRVQVDYAFLTQQIARLEEENRTLRRKADYASEPVTAVLETRPDPPSIVAEKLIAAADEAAKQYEAEAKAEADRIVREAGAQGSTIVEEAQRAAERIKAEGLAEKYRRSEELERQHAELGGKVAELRSAGEQVKRALSEALSSVGSLQ